MAHVTEAAAIETDEDHDDVTIVLDLGKKSRKSVKKLRKGRGKLMARVHATIDQLRADDELSESSDLVVVIVKQKSRSRGLFF